MRIRWSRVARWGAWVAVGALVLAWGLWLALGRLMDAGCTNRVLDNQPSPDGHWRAVVFERNCGASTGFSTQVSVLAVRAELRNRAGNLFIADTDHGAAPSGRGGGPAVTVQWRSARQLVVRHHPAARVFKAMPSVNGVAVSYRVEP
ncbi:MAG: hypothetical protein KF871_13865 [Hydrogenophaga sp.]|uniref:hypothetical protein n=1 Tax=Hydrogenophaga sp. TaxID=1904254 RepID=UPI001D4489D5|nr:hypothetical protein [Hydrogenophaga sp.]MBX3610972.1 hypothetical protein [Hydrogenophaga sp.]